MTLFAIEADARENADLPQADYYMLKLALIIATFDNWIETFIC